MTTVSKSDLRLNSTPAPWRRIKERATRTSRSKPFGPWAFLNEISSGVIVHEDMRKDRSWQNETAFKQIRLSGGVLPDHSYYCELRNSKSSKAQVLGQQYLNGFLQLERTVYDFEKAPVMYMPPPSATLTISDVASKLIERAKGSQFQTPVFLAEAKKTSTMVSEAALSLVTLARAARKGDFRYFFNNLHVSFENKPGKRQIRRWNKRFVRDASATSANLWLQYRYGWIPFMSEARAAVNTLMDVAERPESSVMTVKTSKKKTTSSGGTNHLLFNAGADGGILCDSVQLLEESIRVAWKFRPSDGSIAGRFGLLNPLEVAWELFPFSFVADWFLPIGDYLSQFDVPFRFTHVGGTVGVRRSNKTSFINPRNGLTPAGTGGSGLIGAIGIQTENVILSRSRLNFSPAIALSSISFQPKINAIRAVSSIALLRQQLTLLKR